MLEPRPRLFMLEKEERRSIAGEALALVVPGGGSSSGSSPRCMALQRRGLPSDAGGVHDGWSGGERASIVRCRPSPSMVGGGGKVVVGVRQKKGTTSDGAGRRNEPARGDRRARTREKFLLL